MSNLYFAFLHKETSGLLKVVYAVPFFTRRRRFTWIKVGMKQSETRRLKRIVSVKAWFMADRNYLIRIGSVNLWSSFYFMYLWHLKYVLLGESYHKKCGWMSFLFFKMQFFCKMLTGHSRSKLYFFRFFISIL